MRRRRAVAWLALTAAAGVVGLLPAVAQDVTDRTLLDNARVHVAEVVFPPGFRGDEHPAAGDEFAYVVDGEFTVLTRGQGRRVVRRGEVEWAARGTVHQSLNESRRPARVLVVILKP